MIARDKDVGKKIIRSHTRLLHFSNTTDKIRRSFLPFLKITIDP